MSGAEISSASASSAPTVFRIRRHALVPDLGHGHPRAPHGRDVAPPGPRGPPGVADLRELLTALLLDPEAGPRAEGRPGVVAAAALGAQPAALQQRADHVAPVPQGVHDPPLGEGLDDRREDVGHLGGLLERPDPAHEAETPRAGEEPADLFGGLRLVEMRDPADGVLERLDLPEVDEPGHGADRGAEERRARPGAADDEDEPVVARPEALPGERCLREDALGRAQLQLGGAEQAVHGPYRGSVPQPRRR